MSETPDPKESKAVPEENTREAGDPEDTVSPVLTRLIEEVRIENARGRRAYDRVHNRHNR